MATSSNRGRPVILDKAELDLGNGGTAVIRLVGDGSTVQVELPMRWEIDTLQRSVSKTGGRTKLTFTTEALVEVAPEPEPEPEPEPAPVAKRAPRKRAPRKAAAAAAAA
jgi:hypothetical protein